MVSYQEIFNQLQSFGVFDVLIPFILFFALTFAILQRVNILGEPGSAEARKYNALVALVIGLLVVVPHVTGSYPPGTDIVEMVNNALPNVSLVLIVLLTAFILIAMWGGKPTWQGAGTGWVSLLSILIIAFIFARAAGFLETWPSWLDWLDDPSTQALVVIVLAFVIIIGYITGKPESELTPDEKKAREEASILKALGKLFGGN